MASLDLRVSNSLPQGGFYALVGPPSEGKGTLLKLLSGVILRPLSEADAHHHMEGDVVIPTHLRVLNIVSTPCFMDTTLLKNLVWGTHDCTQDADLKRVVDICRSLGVSEPTIQIVEQDKTVCNWGATLSGTEASLLHIARGLIANPEVLCMHKPTLYLQADLGEVVYGLLNTFVKERGLKQDLTMYQYRRPRTCIVTARSTAIAEVVDAAFHVSKDHGMQMLVRSSGGEWVMSTDDLSQKASQRFRESQSFTSRTEM
jgi:ABC-type branched-subunit amino acid transport system ATPase component